MLSYKKKSYFILTIANTINDPPINKYKKRRRRASWTSFVLDNNNTLMSFRTCLAFYYEVRSNMLKTRKQLPSVNSKLG